MLGIFDQGIPTGIMGAFIGCFPSILPILIILAIWGNYANNISIILEQNRVVAVYEQQRDELRKTMEQFNYPKGSAALNMDSPIAAIIVQLGNTESSLAKARAHRAEAYKAITATKLGPMSGVTNWVTMPEVSELH